MFVDFNRVFKGKPQTELRIPDAMVEHLSSRLPEGVRYRADDNGNCEIVSEGGPISFGGLIFVPTEEDKKVLGKKFSVNDVLSYSYNAQKRIPLQLKKEGVITLNGEEFPIDRLHYNPYCPVTFVSGEMFMYPHPFPAPFTLEVGCEKYSRELTFKRIPNESVHIAAFESESEQPLVVKYFLDETKNTIAFNISFNLSYAKTVRDVVETTFIYNAFADDKGLLCGHPLVTGLDTSGLKKYDLDSALFWEKVLYVETALGLTFIPPQEDIDFSTIRIVEMLYQNLIQKLPTRDNKKIDSLDGEWEMRDDNAVKDSIGKSIYFEFQATYHMSLFGAEKDLPCVIGIFNSKLTNYTVKGKKYKLLLDHLSEEQHMYTSTLRFATEDELQAYMSGGRNGRITALHSAKTPEDFLSEKGNQDVSKK